MSDGIFHRARRQFEPRTRDERGRELSEREARTSDQGATERPDREADALLGELARRIGEPDPFAPTPGHGNERHANEARNPGGRLADLGRGSPNVGAEDLFLRPRPRYPEQPQDRSYQVRLHEPRLVEGRSFEDRLSSDQAAQGRRADNFDFLELSGRDEYPVAPQQGRSDDRDYDRGDDHEDLRMGHRHPAYGEQEEYADEYGEDAHEHDDDYESEHDDSNNEESGRKRRSTTRVVIAVLGLAVFGSAAAFGYRTIFKAPPSGPTPVIRADNSPTKMIPAGTDANQTQAGEQPSDSSGERLVRRDEDPIDVGATYRSAPSGNVGATGSPPDTAGSPPPATVPPSGGPASSSDTRRVRTVTIRSDQGTTAADRPAAAASRPATPPAPPRQVAALAPPTTSAPPTATAPAAARATDAGGGFVVQISAQRSEAEAQAAFRTMQGKYAVLNGHELIIKRKDQGDRGIFYAAQVGPFGAKSEADQLCETLKSAGGTCFVQRN